MLLYSQSLVSNADVLITSHRLYFSGFSIPCKSRCVQVNYIADSETEQVEWVSALEGAVAKIVRAVAGVEDEDHAPSSTNNGASNNSNWSSQLEQGFASMSKSSSSRPLGNAMVHIVGYGGGGGSGSHAAHRSSSMARDNGDYGSTSINYGQIAGTA